MLFRDSQNIGFEGLTSNKSPNEQSHTKDGHDERLCHEEISQLGNMQPEKGQLDDDEQEEAEHLSRSDMCTERNVIRKVLEGWPYRLQHCLDTLASLETLGSKPYRIVRLDVNMQT